MPWVLGISMVVKTIILPVSSFHYGQFSFVTYYENFVGNPQHSLKQPTLGAFNMEPQKGLFPHGFPKKRLASHYFPLKWAP